MGPLESLRPQKSHDALIEVFKFIKKQAVFLNLYRVWEAEDLLWGLWTFSSKLAECEAKGVLLFLKIASSTLCLSTIRNAVQNPDDYFGCFWLEIPVDYKKHFTNFQG